jgi:hypothetical protein
VACRDLEDSICLSLHMLHQKNANKKAESACRGANLVVNIVATEAQTRDEMHNKRQE